MYLRRNAIEKQIKSNGFFEVGVKRGAGETLFLNDIKGVLYAVLVEDSIERNLYSQSSIERMKETVKSIINIEDENILIILLGDKYVDAFKYNNVICINAEKSSIKNGKLNDVFKDLLDRFIGLSAYNNMQGEAISQGEQISRLQPKKVVLTYLIVALNIFFFIKYGGNSYDMWGVSANKVLEEGQSYRLYTYMFMHGNILHLLNNTLSLLALGILLEKRIGFKDFAAVYMVSGMLASFLSISYNAYWTGNVTYSTVGASGAIFGLMGAYWVDYMMDSSVIQKKNLLVYFIFLLAFNSLGGNIDVMCHVGGFMGGAYIMYLLNTVHLTNANNIFIKNMRKCNKMEDFR